MEHLFTHHTHASADEIYAAVNRRFPRASRATVYNNLNALVRSGLVRRLATGNGGARYDASLDRHHHFVCEHCGRIDDVAWFPVPGIEKRAAIAKGSSLRGYEITLRGVCAACAASNSEGGASN
jgi:Fe2+ or Zn2+ uptake regulation protein